MSRIAIFGGIYNNYLALQAALADVQRRGVDVVYCLGDMGAFGPHPDRVFPLLRDHNVQCIQGNYDNSVGNGLPDCQCGYTDPRDNHFARLSYAYTFANTSHKNRAWLHDLPSQLRITLGKYRFLLCHGSPRRTNEFLWESTTSTHFLDQLLLMYDADVVLATHSGIKWHRRLANDRHFVNVGVLGRPENDGTTNVWYTLLEAVAHDSNLVKEATRLESFATENLSVEFVPVTYDCERLAAEMRAECIPQEFIETVLTGWWTTCLEVLPAKERKRARF